MLTENERLRINHERPQYKDERALCIDALKIIQEERGWISDEVIGDVAEYLHLAPAEVEGVATFFNLIYWRRPGQHVILICDSVSCWTLGSKELIDHLQKKLGIKLGQTTPDGMFTLLPAACLGICDKAPAMMIDRELYTELTCQKADEILDSFRKGSRPR